MNQRLIVMLLLLAASGLAVSETDISEPRYFRDPIFVSPNIYVTRYF